MWFGLLWPEIGCVVGCCNHGNEHSDFVTQNLELLEWLSDYQLSRTDSSLWNVSQLIWLVWGNNVSVKGDRT